MATLYRSMWQAGSADAVGVVDAAFTCWAEGRARMAHHPLCEQDGRVRASARNRYVLRRDVHTDPNDTKIGAAVRVDLVEAIGSRMRRTWVRAWSGGSTEGEGVAAWVWVDVEEVTDELDVELQVGRPDFLPDLLASTAASRHGIELRGHARTYSGPDGAEALGELLTLDDRDVPVVVLAETDAELPGSLDLPAGLVERVADDLAGLAVVAHVDDAARGHLTEVLGTEYGLGPGGMRVYLPVLDPAAGLPTRHVEYGVEAVQDGLGAAATLALREIERPAVARRAPKSWDNAWRRLDDTIPSAEVLERMDAQRTETVRELEEQLKTMRTVAEDLFEEAVGYQALAGRLAEQLEQARTSLGRLRAGLPDDQAREDEPECIEVPRSVAAAVALARGHLADDLDLPESATERVTELDSQQRAPLWAGRAWAAFQALAAYAQAARAGFPGDFRRWCLTSGDRAVLPGGTVAMGESDTTTARWGDQRTFRVDDKDVAMFAHIKLPDTGRTAPRIHFAWLHRTQRIHIGYVGPHLRNTRT